MTTASGAPDRQGPGLAGDGAAAAERTLDSDEAATLSPAPPGRLAAAPLEGARRWLGRSRLGLAATALVVGSGAGVGAVVFRYLIFGFTWLATGHEQFGQQGHVASLHLPGLGIWFVLLVPVLGGLLYGPLIQRFAQEARGHGVPEVMLAVAESGGRIRPPVTIVKAIASAVCIGVGGSVGREGPIVQIGSAFASTIGQLVRLSETRLRIIVACGAAGGIAATFNAPVTGLFFGFEIVLREFSLDALFATILSAVTADLVSRAFFGSGPFFAQMPHHLVLTHDGPYLLVAVLGLAAGLIGVGFKTALYGLEDRVDELWKGRPEWARPAVGGLALGLVLLALPQMYGVGYPVMNRVVAGHAVLWLLVVLALGKIVAASLSLAIGGSGGVFAPSLFTGAAAGMAFGLVARHLFGPAVGTPAVYGVVAMGGVFGAAAQAPLTSIASVVEMTGDFRLTLPVMLVVGIATALSKRLTYGSIYTTKLLRRGIDIERPKPTSVLQVLTVADVVRPLPAVGGHSSASSGGSAGAAPDAAADEDEDDIWAALVGPVVETHRPRTLRAGETLEQTLRQLVVHGRRAGLPVLSRDGHDLLGWITLPEVLRVLGERVGASAREAERDAPSAEVAVDEQGGRLPGSSAPLPGYEVVELAVGPRSPARGRRVRDVPWPSGCVVVAVGDGRELGPLGGDAELRAGTHVVLLAPVAPAVEGPNGRDGKLRQ